MYDRNNVFAKIVRGELPCKKVGESEHALAFDNIDPKADIHLLVVPKGEYENVADFIANASVAEQTDFWNLALETATTANIKDGFRLVANTGKSAGQSVPHFHIHLMSGNLPFSD